MSIIIQEVIDDVNKKVKRKSKENYFDTPEENAVVEFLNAKTFDEKNKINNKS